VVTNRLVKVTSANGVATSFRLLGRQQKIYATLAEPRR
jgi:hypothetical protein